MKDIYQILVAELAHIYREKHPDLHIEGHPVPASTLVIKKKGTKDGIKIRIVEANVKGTPQPNTIFVDVLIIVKGATIVRNRPRTIIDLNDTASIDTLESWIDNLVQNVVLTDNWPLPNIQAAWHN